ncbi:MAG: hypothetical protein ABW360_12360 [Phenylobacterium sp.]
MAARDRTPAPKAADEAPEVRTYPIPVGDLTINFSEPTDGQIIALRKAGLLFKSSDPMTQNRGGLLYMDVLDALVATPGELDEIYSRLADNSLNLEDYAEAALTLLQTVGDDNKAEAAPRNGPVSTRRARAR